MKQKLRKLTNLKIKKSDVLCFAKKNLKPIENFTKPFYFFKWHEISSNLKHLEISTFFYYN